MVPNGGPRDNDPLHGPINTKLAEIVAGLDTPPTWRDAWTALGPESPEGDRLAVYRAVRDSGLLAEEAGSYLVCWQIDAMTSLAAEARLAELDERMRAIEEAHGLEEGEFWPAGKAPDEYEALRQQYEAAWNRMYLAKLEQLGEHEMARQYASDPRQLRPPQRGRPAFFHGPAARRTGRSWPPDSRWTWSSCAAGSTAS
jgi:hypothetical protein